MLFKAGREVANSVHHSLSIKDLVRKSTCGNQQTHTWGQFHKFNVIFTDFCNLHSLPLHDNNFQPYCCYLYFWLHYHPGEWWWWSSENIVCCFSLLESPSICLEEGEGIQPRKLYNIMKKMHKYQQKYKIIININAKACKFIKFWRRGFNL